MPKRASELILSVLLLTLLEMNPRINFIGNGYSSLGFKIATDKNSYMSFCNETVTSKLFSIYLVFLDAFPIQAPQATAFLLAIYNKIWTTGHFPPAWTLAIILAILKSAKSGHLPQDYCPIALTSCLCKMFERMVNFSLM